MLVLVLVTCLSPFLADYNLEARYHWFRGVNMAVILAIVGSETSIRAPPTATAKEVGAVDLSRTFIQAAAVATYLCLLCVMKPYVHSRLRRWKLWVTASNQGTSLLLILSRLLAEQARANAVENAVETPSTADASVNASSTSPPASSSSSSSSSTTARPAIFTASLAFMYISTIFCILQFAVLIWSFFMSLFEGAKVEQVVIVAEIREKAARAEAVRQGVLHAYENEKQDNDVEDADAGNNVELVMRANPYRDSLQLSRSSTSSGGRSSPSAVAPVDAEQKVDAASLSFAKRPVSLASVRLSGDRASMGDDGDEAAAAAAAAAAAEAARVALDEEERHRVEVEAWAAHEAEEERRKAEEAAHEAEEERLRAEAAAWAAYEAAHSNDGDVNDGGANAEDGKGEDEDEWTTRIDDDSGHMYRYNSRTGETIWLDDTYAQHDAIGDEHDEKGGDNDDDDDLATARSRLRSVMMHSSDEGGNGGALSAYQSLISDTRGDWVVVCDEDGAVLGESLKGETVYFNRTTFETRLTKPSGWVLMQARAISSNGRASDGSSRALPNYLRTVAK